MINLINIEHNEWNGFTMNILWIDKGNFDRSLFKMGISKDYFRLELFFIPLIKTGTAKD